MVYHPINSLGGMRTDSYASFLYMFIAQDNVPDAAKSRAKRWLNSDKELIYLSTVS